MTTLFVRRVLYLSSLSSQTLSKSFGESLNASKEILRNIIWSPRGFHAGLALVALKAHTQEIRRSVSDFSLRCLQIYFVFKVSW